MRKEVLSVSSQSLYVLIFHPGHNQHCITDFLLRVPALATALPGGTPRFSVMSPPFFSSEHVLNLQGCVMEALGLPLFLLPQS